MTASNENGNSNGKAQWAASITLLLALATLAGAWVREGLSTLDRRLAEVERVDRQLEALAAAVRGDDRDAIERAWPLLPLRSKQTTADFRRMFLSVGLPPYHWRCRTVAQEGRE